MQELLDGDWLTDIKVSFPLMLPDVNKHINTKVLNLKIQTHHIKENKTSIYSL